MHNRAYTDWTVPDGTVDRDQAQLAVLMDIRNELQRLNRVIQCANFIDIPRVLRGIRLNTTKPRRKRAASHK